MGPNFIYMINYFILKEKLTDAIIIKFKKHFQKSFMKKKI